MPVVSLGLGGLSLSVSVQVIPLIEGIRDFIVVRLENPACHRCRKCAGKFQEGSQMTCVDLTRKEQLGAGLVTGDKMIVVFRSSVRGSS